MKTPAQGQAPAQKKTDVTPNSSQEMGTTPSVQSSCSSGESCCPNFVQIFEFNFHFTSFSAALLQSQRIDTNTPTGRHSSKSIFVECRIECDADDVILTLTMCLKATGHR